MKKLITPIAITLFLTACGSPDGEIATTTLNPAPQEVVAPEILTEEVATSIIEEVTEDPTPITEDPAPIIEDPAPIIEESASIFRDEESTSDNSESRAALIEACAELMEASLKETLGEDSYVTVDGDFVNAYISMQGLAFDAVMTQALNGGEVPEEWIYMREQCEYACEQWYNAFAENGLSNVHVAFYILNDLNTDNTILTVMDGTTFYDAMENL